MKCIYTYLLLKRNLEKQVDLVVYTRKSFKTLISKKYLKIIKIKDPNGFLNIIITNNIITFVKMTYEMYIYVSVTNKARRISRPSPIYYSNTTNWIDQARLNLN